MQATYSENARMKRLHQHIENAMNAKGRKYDLAIATNLMFDNDNTGAAEDLVRFSHILNMLHLPKPQDLILRTGEGENAFFQIVNLLQGLSKHTSAVQGQSLVILYYAGHASYKDDEFSLGSASSADDGQAHFEHAFHSLWATSGLFKRTDVLVVLDCRHADMVTRAVDPTRTRSVEIVSAVPDRQRAVGSREIGPRAPFTMRLTYELAKQIGRTEGRGGSIGFRDLVAGIRSGESRGRDPQYRLKVGCLPLLFPVGRLAHAMGLAGSLPTGSTPMASSMPLILPLQAKQEPQYSVMFTATVDDCDVNNAEHSEIVSWIRSAGLSVGLKLINIYKSRSYGLTFIAPWKIWVVLDGLPMFKFVRETTGEDLLPSFESRPSQ